MPPAAPAASADGEAGSKRRRWLAGSRGSWAWTWRRSTGSGPGGRIVKADVEKAGAVPRRAPRSAPRSPPHPPPQVAIRGWMRRGLPARRRDAGDREGADHVPGPHPPPAGGRPADVGVEGDGAALLPADRDRHVGRGGGAGADQGDDAREGEVVPSFNDMVVKACALALQGVPARQRRLQGRALRALLAGQRGRRGGRPGRARRADRLRRRPQGPAGDRRRRPGAGRARSGTARSPRRSSPAAPSRSPTSGCTG